MVSEPHPLQNKKPGRHWLAPGFLLPAVEALLIQLVSLILLCLTLWFAARFDWLASIGVAVLLQGAMAAMITWRRRLALWWLPIQFFFPLALLLAYSLKLSPLVYLLIFVLLLLVYWMPFKTRVPLYLSGESVWEKVADFFPENVPVRFLDVGSGMGGLSLYLARRFPQARITGIELAPFPWVLSWLRARVLGAHVRFVWGDYNNFDFSQFDMVFTFLSPAVMEAIWEKATADMQQGTVLLSYEFSIPDVKPDILVEVGGSDAMLYGWRISKAFEKRSSSS